MSTRGPMLPGNRAPRRPADEDADAYDRPQLQQRILDALKAGPLEKWRLRDALQVGEHKIARELVALKEAKQVKWVGRGRRQAQWALASCPAPAPSRVHRSISPTHLFPQAKRQPPTESWWTTARTREEFNQKLQERTQASGSAFGPVPYPKR